MIRLTLSCALLLLVACVPQQGTLVTRDTGLSGSYGAQIPISDHAQHVLMGHLIDVTRDGDRVRALVVSHRYDGVNRLRMREAWVDGVELPFRAIHRTLDGCTHGHCRDRAVGMIFLSDAVFADASAHGFRARLLGSSDTVDITVPASLFQALPNPPQQTAN